MIKNIIYRVFCLAFGHKMKIRGHTDFYIEEICVRCEKRGIKVIKKYFNKYNA